MALKKVVVNLTNLSTIKGKWMEPFNQATFFNYDTTGTVTVNGSQVIPAAQNIGGFIYPTVMEISLNTEEVNDTYFTFDFASRRNQPNLQVIYTTYKDQHV